jgi:putative sigma-54 modulation protein
MKISYTGRHEVFPQKPRAKFEAKLQKLSKMVERKGEKEAHVILSQQRFLHTVEITIHAWDHAMVGIGSNGELVAAASDALDKLEKQILKIRSKWRDTKRHKASLATGLAEAPSAPPAKSGRAPIRSASSKRTSPNSGRKKVFRVNHSDGKKPMTLDEAMLEMEASQDYMVYRDAQTDRVTVLMRRSDGHYDLIES